MQEFLSLFLLFQFYQQDITYLKDINDNIIIESIKNHKPGIVINNKNTDFLSDSVLLIDQNSSHIYFEKNMMKKLPIASITKLMSAIVAIENINLNTEIEIPQREIPQDDISTLPIGEKFTAKQLLTMALVSSNNDAIYAIANYIGYNNFVEKMNKKANEYKMYHTKFSNPIGYDEDNNYSTAIDVYILAKKAISNPIISEIINMNKYEIYSKKGNIYTAENTNKLLKDEFLNNYIYGIKTGTTKNAKECLIFWYKKQNTNIIGILLGSTNRYKDAKNFLYYINNKI